MSDFACPACGRTYPVNRSTGRLRVHNKAGMRCVGSNLMESTLQHIARGLPDATVEGVSGSPAATVGRLACLLHRPLHPVRPVDALGLLPFLRCSCGVFSYNQADSS